MNIDKIQSILASEIECSVFEKHVMPALVVAKRIEAEESAAAWMVKGHFTELFSDLEEAHKYAATIGAKVVPLYAESGD